MSNHEKGILEKAAASADPVVRQVAMRRMEIEQELSKLDLFLRFYADEQIPNGSVAPKKTKIEKIVSDVPVQKPTKLKEKKARTSKGPKVADAACQILVEIGHPLDLTNLFSELQDKFSAICPPKKESLRPRLHEQRDKIAMIKGKGYWPAGLPLPDLPVEVATTANE